MPAESQFTHNCDWKSGFPLKNRKHRAYSSQLSLHKIKFGVFLKFNLANLSET